MNSCQATLNAVMVERQQFVIDPEQVERSGMEIIGVSRINCRLPAQFIRFAIADASLYTTTGKPRGEGIRIMIPPLAILTLGGWLASKFCSADH